MYASIDIQYLYDRYMALPGKSGIFMRVRREMKSTDLLACEEKDPHIPHDVTRERILWGPILLVGGCSMERPRSRIFQSDYSCRAS